MAKELIEGNLFAPERSENTCGGDMLERRTSMCRIKEILFQRETEEAVNASYEPRKACWL